MEHKPGTRPSTGSRDELAAPDLAMGLLPTLRSVTDWLPAMVKYPFFGGQVATVALVVLVVWLARALSTSADLLLATAALGSVLIHSALGALAQSEARPYQRAGAITALGLGALIAASAVAMTIVLVVWRHS